MYDKSQLMRGTLEGCILKILSKNTSYGYEIVTTLLGYGFKDIKEGLYETDFIIVYKGNEYNIKTKLIGINNVYNICASVLTCILLGLTIEDCISAINNFSMKGRMENYKGVIIDFAVTVDALRKNMQFLSKNKKGKIISVIGRLEERDIFEYKEFGKISTKYSDYVIFTTDRNNA